jgi:hypothetical protein
MPLRTASVLTCALGIGALLLCVAAARAEDEGLFDQKDVAAARDLPAQDGVQPQARGPVHEAFATPATGAPQPGPVVSKQPPAMIEEMPPETRPAGDNVQWYPGYWGWDEDTSDFLWVSGIWRTPPPGRQWVPGTWSPVSAGYQWSAGFWKPVEADDLHLVPEPPAPLAEAAPPAPDDNSVLLPGGWVYRESRYVWRPCCWVPYRAGWVWVPGYYVCTPCGYVYVEGYWDYVLCDRGLLFAPVCIDYRVIRRGWYYTPCYVVHDTCLLGALFVRGGGYVFGDYYDSIHAGRGYVFWLDVRIGRRCIDPLFAYYAHHYRRTAWEHDLRTLTSARFRGEAPRPPRTLADQQRLTVNLKDTVVLAPVTKVNKKVMPLVTLEKSRVLEIHESAAVYHEASKQRASAEGKLFAAGTTAKKPGDAAVSLKLDLPKGPVVNTLPNGKTPPPLPVVVKKDEKSVGGKDVKGTPTKPVEIKPVTPPSGKTDKDKVPPPVKKDPPTKSDKGKGSAPLKKAEVVNSGKTQTAK